MVIRFGSVRSETPPNTSRDVVACAILVYIVAFGVVPAAALSGSLRQIGSLVPTGSGEALGPVAVG